MCLMSGTIYPVGNHGRFLAADYPQDLTLRMGDAGRTMSRFRIRLPLIALFNQ